MRLSGTAGLPKGWRGEWDSDVDMLRLTGPNKEELQLSRLEVEQAGSMQAALEARLTQQPAVPNVFPPESM